MRLMLLLLAVVLSVGRAAAAPVTIDSGQIQGVHEGSLTVFKGVPFAAPPVGALRWREPQRPQAWSGIRRADRFAPACMQRGVSMPGEAPPQIGEDCLYLNIWTPASASTERRPVLVWIYGGGWANGSASMPLYWGDALARKGIVVVTIAYRVGAFGFLAHPELTRESAHGSSGNYGLMDQIAALSWVQRNIAAFGGDPGQVTIAGQSAGSMAISILMASPQARGLFHRAIGQSGGFFEPVQIAPGYLLHNAEREGEAFAKSIGAASLTELRALPAEKILEGRMPSGPHPVIDPYVLPSPPNDVFAAGKQADVPLLLGANAQEARALVDVRNVRAATFGADIEKSFGKLPPPLYEQYPHATDEEAKNGRIAFESDLRFRWDMWTWARLHASTIKNKVFFYRFDQSPPFPESSPRAGWGASHFAELWYMFDHLDQEPWRWSPADRRLAEAMSSYWANFVKTGNPNGAALPQWPEFKTDSGPIMILSDPAVPGAIENPSRLQTFDQVYSQIRQMPLR